MIASIEHCGPLIPECDLPGERRSDDVFPSHPNGLRVARNRYLLIYATRGYRGADDNLSVCYQLREGSYDGPLIKEDFLVRSVDNWDAFGDGHAYVRQHGHPVAFGVPAGARIDGRTPAHAGLFAIKWRRVARRLEADGSGLLADPDSHVELTAMTQGVEWTQVRLREDGNDLEVVQPPTALRQKGYDAGSRLCSADVAAMNQSYTQPCPYTPDGSEWVDCNHFDQTRFAGRKPAVAILRYRYNPDLGHFEWVQTGPPIFAELMEPSLVAPGPDGTWILESRTMEGAVRAGVHVRGKAPIDGAPLGWASVADLFTGIPKILRPEGIRNNAPVTAFRFADSAVRVLTGDPTVSPYKNPRNPLYLWDVDPAAGFATSNRREIFDIVATGIPIPVEDQPKCEMAKLLPHAGGRTQILLHGVYPRSVNVPGLTGRVVPPEAKAQTGIYYARIHYTEDQPSQWDFG